MGYLTLIPKLFNNFDSLTAWIIIGIVTFIAIAIKIAKS
jgi:hypothetical protein